MEEYSLIEFEREDVDTLKGGTLLEFGSQDCGHCRRLQPLLAKALAAYPNIRHLKIADGKGRPLGRSFEVTLWPTLIFLHSGRETARLIRPTNLGEINRNLAQIGTVADSY